MNEASQMVYDVLHKKYGKHMISIQEAGAEIGWARQTCYNKMNNGQFPVPLYHAGGYVRVRVRITELAMFLSGEMDLVRNQYPRKDELVL